jgi:serine/threonine-protein kinase
MLDAFGMSSDSIAPDSSSQTPTSISGEPRQFREIPILGAADVVGGRYQIVQKLEEGERAALFIAQDRATQDIVTLKRCHDPHDGRLLRHQLVLSRAVSHPNVVRVHDYVDSEEGPVLVMEGIDETLRHQFATRRRQGGYDAEAIRGLAVSLSAALAAIHARGLVHGAVSPSSVFAVGAISKLLLSGPVTERERRLCDAASGTLSTDARYQSPERLLDPSPSRADDVYALGIVLWEALTLGTPKTGMSPRAYSVWEDCHSSVLYDLSIAELRTVFAALSPTAAMRPSASRVRRAMSSALGLSISDVDDASPKASGFDPGPPLAHAETVEFSPERQGLLLTYSSTAPELVGSLVPQRAPELSLGRHSQDINLPERTLSGCHVRLEWERGTWHVLDQGSANGTYVDGASGRQTECVLRHGVEVQLGELRAMLVSFGEGSAHHWKARQYLGRREGLTGLHAGRYFVRLVDEDVSFARWADMPAHVVCFAVQFARGTAWVDAMPLLREIADHIVIGIDQLWPGVATVGCIEKAWRRDPSTSSNVFATLLGRPAADPLALAREIASRALESRPRGTRVLTGIAAASADQSGDALLAEAARAASAPKA